ncbi:hypothetical protein PAT3040_03462 [Paenibacillus agaridevorans]|uniref:Uncharacterized protein n=1 Tax=Paenibacillus agaridevorans TaxID=171404 RepID=A0A2R5EQL1_9BACL|nr:hypothetical protein PAT3040_03462 [Paenibacillus agaridevorans]
MLGTRETLTHTAARGRNEQTYRHNLAEYVLRKVKNVGKPYAGKPHVRFDEEGLAVPALR